MAGVEEAFGEALRKKFKAESLKGVVLGTAKNVTDRMCDVAREGEPDLKEVKLHVVDDELNSRMVVKPKTGSVVLAAIMENDEAEACLLMCSEIDEVLIEIGSKIYKVNSSGHLIADENDSLKQVLTLIIEAVQQVLVMNGNNPDYEKLATALTKTNKIFA